MTNRVPAPRRVDPFRVLLWSLAAVAIVALYPTLDHLLNG